MKPPAGLVAVREGARCAWVRAEAADRLAQVLWHGTDTEPLAGPGGRGTVARFEWAGGAGVRRVYRRGGWMAHLLRDYYLLQNRPLRELVVNARMHAAGLPVPEPLGACWRRRGPCYAGAMATAYVPGSTLANHLSTQQATPARHEALRRAGAAIRRFHNGGGWHADLNATNIVLQDTGDACLIDLDKARFAGYPVQGAAAVRNLLRLRRSLDKLGHGDEAWHVLLAGYGGSAVPAWLERLYAARGHASDALAGRHTT